MATSCYLTRTISFIHLPVMAPSAITAPTTGPPRVVGPATKTATRPTQPLPKSLIDGARVSTKQSFDPKRHMNFHSPSKIYTMKEIGLDGEGISPNAVSEPFPLFTEEAIKYMRSEIFNEPVLENCQYASTFNKNMIRGMGPAYATPPLEYKPS